MDVVADIRARLADPRQLAEVLGLLEGSKREGRGIHVRCPVHAERSPSCSITIGPDGTVRAKCFGCDWSGDALGLVGAVRGLNPDREFRKILAEAARLAGVDLAATSSAPASSKSAAPEVAPPRPAPQPARAPLRPPVAELTALWQAAGPLAATQVDPTDSDLAISHFCARRRWWPAAVDSLKVVRALPLEHDFPAWWPATWAQSWRLAVLAFEADGRIGSIHARAIDEQTPKTRWPRNCEASGLFFATLLGRALLRAQKPHVEGVVLVEGLTDFIAAALAMEGRPWAVLGATSGSFPALAKLAWPEGVRAVVATDQDPAGERYFREIRAALPHVDVRRWRPPEVHAA